MGRPGTRPPRLHGRDRYTTLPHPEAQRSAPDTSFDRASTTGPAKKHDGLTGPTRLEATDVGTHSTDARASNDLGPKLNDLVDDAPSDEETVPHHSRRPRKGEGWGPGCDLSPRRFTPEPPTDGTGHGTPVRRPLHRMLQDEDAAVAS